MSINIELPTAQGLADFAPEKDARAIRISMGRLREKIDTAKGEARDRARAKSGVLVGAVGAASTRVSPAGAGTLARAEPMRFAPGGQSTQMIVGADASDDATILATSANLYGSYRLRRVYYSAFSPIPDASAALPLKAPPLVREHRLYQADWLMRFYGFQADEIVQQEDGLLALDIDPKLGWALAHRERFPVDVNRAPREELLRVPGLGTKTVERLIASRRHRRIRSADLARLRIALARVLPFVVLADHHPVAGDLDAARLRSQLLRAAAINAPQLSLFG